MLKTSFLSALLMSSFIASVPAKTLDVTTKKSPVVKDVYSGVDFTYFDQEDRLLILNSFLKAVELDYSLLPLKAKRIGLDLKKIKEEAVALEKSVPSLTLTEADRKNPFLRDRVAFIQAHSNMEFLDRMQLLVAKFEDTHFGLYLNIARPVIYNGVRLFRVQDKIVVGSLETKFLAMASKLSGADLTSIEIGDEVIAIDGVPVEEKIKELKAYMAGSSDEFRDSQAIRALTLRDFKYEKKNYMRIQFKKAGNIKLPLFANVVAKDTQRVDASAYFKQYNIPIDTASIGISFDKANNKWIDTNLTYTGYSVRKIQGNIKGVTEYNDDAGGVGLRTGYYINKGKTYGYMQLLTFSTKNLKNGETAAPFISVIRNFILDLKENDLPLIFDLRSNGGGNGSFPAAVLSLLTEEKAEYPGATSGLRITHYMRQVQDPFLRTLINAEDENTLVTGDDFLAMLEKAIDERQEFTPMYASDPVVADAKVKGFSNKIVALVTADCISACDKMSFLLKASKRATIIGTHSNGTGAGFLSTGELNTQWQDPLRLFNTQIPNYLFGIPGGDTTTGIFEEDSVSRLCTENRPTQADVQYSNTMVDITKNNLGWLQKAAQVLDEK